MNKERTFSQCTLAALQLFAKQIQLGRKQYKWSEHELATRAGISRATLQKIEKANPGVAIGLFFEVAVLVGVTLFDEDEQQLATARTQIEQTLKLLPKSIHKSAQELDDEF